MKKVLRNAIASVNSHWNDDVGWGHGLHADILELKVDQAAIAIDHVASGAVVAG